MSKSIFPSYNDLAEFINKTPVEFANYEKIN